MSLLDKATIITTPTAHSNGVLHSIKGGSVADFDVVRGSAATRVNAEGLIEDISTLSGELVTNGGFDTDTNWAKELGWSISGGRLIGTSVTTGLAFQSNAVEANKSYKATYDVVVTSGSIGLYFDGGTGYKGTVTTTQTVTVFFKATTASPLYFRSDTSNFTGSIDNISVVEVTRRN